MKKNNLLCILVFICCLFLFIESCKKDNNQNKPKEDELITIYSVNDFHGAIKEKASKVGKYIIDNFSETKDNTLVLSAGDMFQGTGLSNLHYGKDMIDIMNIINFDAMTVGNHEFDWGLETILNYFDGNFENGEADFPILGCNVIDKRTNELPENMDAYTIIERGELKFGIIGYIGYGLENSIATNRIANYEFMDPVPIIEEISLSLRREKEVDVVIACGHDASNNTNRDIANLEGDKRVDAIINGHSHAKTTGSIKRQSDGINVPYVQAGSSGESVGKVELTYSYKDDKVVKAKSSTQTITNLSKENEEIKTLVDRLIADTADVFERVIGISGCDLNQFSAATWSCNAMREYIVDNYGECDIAFTNIGGIRESAFPIKENESITVERIYQMVPFDNAIKTVKLKGSVIKALLQNPGELSYSSSTVKIEGHLIYINGEIIEDNKIYAVACIDYIFDKDTYPFLKGEDIVTTGVLFRDLLIENIENATKLDKKCFL